MPDPNRNPREKRGTANLSNLGMVDIYYAGGSTFEFGIRNDTGKYLRITKTKLESLIDQGLVVITAPKRYADITNSISSDGSTKDQNADGTPKSAVARTMDMLSEDNIINQRSDGKYEVVESAEDKAKAGAKKNVSLFGDDDDDEDLQSPSEPQVPIERPSVRMSDPDDPFGDDDEEDEDLPEPRRRRSTAFEDKHRNEMRKQALSGQGRADQAALEEFGNRRSAAPIEEGKPAKKRKTSTPSGIPGDFNGDGLVDTFDEIEEERRSKSLILIGLLTAASIGAIALSLLTHTLVLNIMDATGIQVSHDDQITQNLTNSEEGQDAEQENGETPQSPQAPDNAKEGKEAPEDDSLYSFGERTYDPEDAVRVFALADLKTQQDTIGFIDHLQALYLNGKVNEVRAIVELDKISNTLGVAYGTYAQEIQHLSDEERDSLAVAWSEQFNKQERTYIVDHDLTRSIFGGKLREVRKDATNDNLFYIVMESVSGDHQRAAFTFIRNEKGYYHIDDILSPNGYIKMICEGTQQPAS